MLYLARALGCVVGLSFKQLNKKYARRKKVETNDYKESYFIPGLYCMHSTLLTSTQQCFTTNRNPALV